MSESFLSNYLKAEHTEAAEDSKDNSRDSKYARDDNDKIGMIHDALIRIEDHIKQISGHYDKISDLSEKEQKDIVKQGEEEDKDYRTKDKEGE